MADSGLISTEQLLSPAVFSARDCLCHIMLQVYSNILIQGQDMYSKQY